MVTYLSTIDCYVLGTVYCYNYHGYLFVYYRMLCLGDCWLLQLLWLPMFYIVGGWCVYSYHGNLCFTLQVVDVYEFIKALPGCASYADEFRSQEIDGQALMLLKEDHLMTTMSMKLGPALKICAKINSLKEGHEWKIFVSMKSRDFNWCRLKNTR